MKHALRIVSLATLVALGAAIIGQAFVVMIGVAYAPDGIPLDPTPQAQAAGGLASFGSLFGAPLAVATFTLSLVAMAQARHFGWLVGIAPYYNIRIEISIKGSGNQVTNALYSGLDERCNHYENGLDAKTY